MGRMRKPRLWPSERKLQHDRLTGVEVCRLTSYLGHSHHLYFTHSGWYAGGAKLLFGSDRENATNLFALRLESGEIEQLTDLEPGQARESMAFLTCSISPVRDVACFFLGGALVALDLATLEQRVLWVLPEGFVGGQTTVTADGLHVVTAIREDLSDRFRVDLQRGYVGFEETWAAHPLSRILLIPLEGGPPRAVHEEQTWIGHVNASPTLPATVTFCHEGPWHLVDNRIWTLDLDTGRHRALRPRRTDGEMVGHEYWLADGRHVGYHGWASYDDWRAGRAGRKFFGRADCAGDSVDEMSTPHQTGHMHSNDFRLVVGDGFGGVSVLRLWVRTGDAWDGPRVLCEHRSSFHTQAVHVHPRLSPDGRSVLYTSDTTGYGNLYMVRIPEPSVLPPLDPALD